MSATEQATPEPKPRKKTALNDDEMWSVSGKPPEVTEQPAAAPAAPVAPANPAASTRSASRAPARTRETRGHARDLAEARGRKQVRDAAHAWASAARKAADRRDEVFAEWQLAIGRGSDRELMATFMLEACERHGMDWHLLPEEIRADIARYTET
ncbi:hypothetical protein [Nocardia yamanashiensis]|uniref:hypothetical protein n=1 Tax=Nocardia yamanashiensis TaxID=209247 RepID=UPI00083034F4|nr:hypothetical protein [Nocardia yamanashiensis]